MSIWSEGGAAEVLLSFNVVIVQAHAEGKKNEPETEQAV